MRVEVLEGAPCRHGQGVFEWKVCTRRSCAIYTLSAVWRDAMNERPGQSRQDASWLSVFATSDAVMQTEHSCQLEIDGRARRTDACQG
jgi:hypothetical protein